MFEIRRKSEADGIGIGTDFTGRLPHSSERRWRTGRYAPESDGVSIRWRRRRRKRLDR